MKSFSTRNLCRSVAHSGPRAAARLLERGRLWCLAVAGALLLGMGWLGATAQAAGVWTPVANPAPENIDTMLLLTDGSVMAASGEPSNGGIGNVWYKLTPDSHGSYVNGTWTTLAPMHDTRLYYSSQVLPDGRVFIAGGEYGSGGSTAEIYDPLANTWTVLPDAGGQDFLDSGSMRLPGGKVLVAPVFPNPIGSTVIYDPTLNTWLTGISLVRGFDQDEASWTKLPDDSVLTVDPFGINSERFIPALNNWVNDSTVPVRLYDNFLFEMGPAFLLPNGKAFFVGNTGHTALYTPTGNTAPGVWVAGPDLPNGSSVPDAPGAMMPNGKILYAVTQAGTNSFGFNTSFLEYDSAANTFAVVPGPTGPTLPAPPFVMRMLDLPDGTVLLSISGQQLFVYQPDGGQLSAGKPTISSVTQNSDGSYHLIGRLLNGISAGAAYGDDAQMDSNYPLVRMVDNTGNVYWGRTYNWSSTSVMTGSTIESADFSLPLGLPPRTYSLTAIANGISSDPIPFTPRPGPALVILTNTISGGNGNGTIDPDECNNLDLVLTNVGSAGATGVQGTLSSSTPGVIIAQKTVTFPDIPTNTAGTNLTSFKVSTTPQFVCGTPVQFTLVLKTDQGVNSSSFVLPSGSPGVPLRFDNNTVVAIPDNSLVGVNSSITVSNITSALNHVKVGLMIQHTFDSDLTLQLIGPDGTTVTLSRNNGGNGQNYGEDCQSDADRTFFDDNGATQIATASAPFLGVFQPQDPLSVFVTKSGTNVNGVWKLHVVDDAQFDVGSIECWSLILTPTACLDGGGQCPGADLAASVHTAVDTVIQGNTLVYQITVTNKGPDTAASVAVNQTLPASVIFVSAISSQGSFTHSGAGVSGNLGAIPAGGSATVSVSVVPTQVGTIFSTVSVGSTQPDPDTSNNSVTISTRVTTPTSDLAVGLDAQPNPVLLGGVLTYTIGVTNNGPSPASLVVVSNQLPAGLSFISSAPSQGNVSVNGSTVLWNVGSLSVGANVQATIQCGVSGVAAVGTIVDTATASALQPDPVPFNNTASVTTVVGPASDLALTMTSSPFSAIYGSNITYQLTVQNLGPSVATNVNLTDTLPPNSTFVGSSPSAGVAVNGNLLTWSVAGNLGVGASTNLTITVGTTSIPSGSLPVSLTNSAIVSATDADPNPGNNTSNIVTVVDNPTVRVVAAGAKLVPPLPADGAIDAGVPVTLQLGLQNIGNINSAAVQATLLATNGVSPSSSKNYGVLTTGGTPGFQNYTFTASGTNGGTIVLTLQLTAGTNLGLVTYTFQLPSAATFYNASNIVIPNPPGSPSVGMGPAGPYPSVINVSGLTNPVSKVTVTITNFSHTFSDDVAMLLVGPAGGGSQKALLLSHVGGVSGTSGASLIFDDTASTTLNASSPITSGTYKPSAYGSVTWPTNTPASPYTTNLSSFNGTDPNGAWSLYVYDGSPGDTGNIIGGWALNITTVQPVNQIVDLAVGGTTAPSPATGGTPLTYTFTISNNGPGAADSGTAFTNVLPAGATFVSASCPLGTATTNGSGAVYCVLTNGLAAGGSTTVTVTVTPNVGVTSLSSRATITNLDTDLTPANNSTNIITAVSTPLADVSIGMAAISNSLTVGSNFAYVIAVTNLGPQTAYSVVVTNPLPAGFTYGGAVFAGPDTAGLTGGAVVWSLGLPLASGAGATLQVTVTPHSLGSVTNTATVSTASSDTNSSNNSASLTGTVVQPTPVIAAVPSATRMVTGGGSPKSKAVLPGQQVTLTLVLTNMGTADTANLVGTLQSGNGITPVTSHMTYGHLVHGGAAVGENFTFTASGGNGAQATAVLQLQDGASNLGTASFVFNLPATNAFASGAAITIPDSGPGNPYPSTINISGLTGLVSKVTVTLSNFNHAFPSDVGILLVAPDGHTSAEVMANAGGPYAVTNVTLGFDDAAASKLPASGPIVAGVYQPSDYATNYPFQQPAPAGPYPTVLAALGGVNPNGTWSLYAYDDSVGDAGNIATGWSLSIATVSPVNPAADLHITLTGPTSPVVTGINFAHTLVVSNRGPADATGVVLTDTLPAAGLNFLFSLPSSTSVAGVLTWNLGTIPANSSTNIVLNFNGTTPNTYTNSATVTANEADLAQADNSVQLSTIVQAVSGTLLKAAPNGGNGTFSLTINGQPEATYVIQTSTDLVTWSNVVTTPQLTTGKYTFIESNIVSTPRRFYRALLQTGP